MQTRAREGAPGGAYHGVQGILMSEKRTTGKDGGDAERLESVCCECGRVKCKDNSWKAREGAGRSHAGISHALCPDCAKKRYPEFFGFPDERESAL